MRRTPLTLMPGLVVLLALAFAGSAVAGNGGFAPPTPESPNAEGISRAYWVIFAFTAAIFVLVETALIVFVVRFRRRGRPRDQEGAQIHGATRLETIWTVGPVVVLALIAGFVFYELPGIKSAPSAAASDELTVHVEGRQFYWLFRYPNGVTAIDTLRIPVGRVVNLDVTSPDYDVIHSWWIPNLGGKIDAIPGRVNHTWIQAQKAGSYRGQCAELCGIFHAAMTASVEALPPQQFDAWLAGRAAQTTSAAVGREEFEGVCLKCHALQGVKFGPALRGNATLSNPAALAQTVRNGIRRMPPVGKGWSDEQMKALVAYTKTLGSQGGG